MSSGRPESDEMTDQRKRETERDIERDVKWKTREIDEVTEQR